MQFEIIKDKPSIIKVIGVGGGGSNAVNHMYHQGIKGVEFLVCNTDAQALEISPVPNKIQLGPSLTEGRGAGSIPEVGKKAAMENIDEIKALLSKNTKMLFVTAGMGGGTGTGAAPIIAGIAKEMGILTVGIVTVPFSHEGRKRKTQADLGIEELKKNVDALLIICNDKLREIHGNLQMSKAFAQADDILTIAAKSIAEIITVTMQVNVDFADIETVMKDSGVAIMGAATADGEQRAIRAAEQAIDSPLLNDNHIEGARYILLNITSGDCEATMDEVGEITEYIQTQAGQTADIIMGIGTDATLGDKIGVTIIATGFKSNNEITVDQNKKPERIVHVLTPDPKVEVMETAIVVEQPKQEVVHVEYSTEPVLIIREPKREEAVSRKQDAVQIQEAGSSRQSAVQTIDVKQEVVQTIQPIIVATKVEEPKVEVIQIIQPVIAVQEIKVEEPKREEAGSSTQEAVQTIEPIIAVTEIKAEPAIDFSAIMEEKIITKDEPIMNVVIDEPIVNVIIDEPIVISELPTEKMETPVAEIKEEKIIEIERPINLNVPIAEPKREVVQLHENRIPAAKPQEQKQLTPEEEMFRNTRERLMKIRETNFKLNSPNGILDLEKEPAYKRRNVQLDHVPASDDSTVSRYTLSTDDKDKKPELRPNNSFLHDKVD